MSRIGKLPVVFDSKVQIGVSADNEITVKGPKSTLKVKMRPEISVKVEGGNIILTRKNEEPQSRALHGLYRSLIQNAITGVTTGFSKQLELVGVGYRANVSGRKLEMTIGYSHPIVFQVPEGIEIKVEKQTQLTISGADRDLVGRVAAKVRGFKEPEPFLGKGIKYVDEKIRRKAGKAAAK